MFGRWRDFFDVLLPMVCVAVVLVAGLYLTISFLSAVARVLRRVDPENRRMEPGGVWLNLIPVFNLVWAAVTVERVAESIRNEYLSRGMDGPREGYGRPAGLTVVVLLTVGSFLELVSTAGRAAAVLFPLVLVYLIAFIYWIVYWVQLNRYTRELKSGAYRPPPAEEGW
ncbi:MAG: hypothetical protein JWO38_7002 [Gemmataceae bacterium]|nr:hypothetical protein [Gemmataceae bacterium]